MQAEIKYIGSSDLRSLIMSDREHAILDAREEGEFGASHLFWAVCCPLSRMELLVPRLLPAKDAGLVCVDDGGDLAVALARYLVAQGYEDVSVLKGGIGAWKNAGHVLFSGVNVPSKAFGEWVEHHFETESVDAAELSALQDSRRDMIIVDSRPLEEFTKCSIPGAINVPGGELVYRIGDLAPSADTLVVVNCAGRTRSILGAESLRRAGIPNKVVALRNGTMGWELAGFRPARGETSRFPYGVPRSASVARERAARFAAMSGVSVIDASELAALQADRAGTLYLFDVRDPTEFAAGHYPGSMNVPGGQLVQETDKWVAVRNARVVLLDADEVRSRMTGAWLRQMGHRHVFVVRGKLPLTETGPGPIPGSVPPGDDEITAEELFDRPGVVVVDLSPSIEFRELHIPGALWGVRTRLDRIGALADASEVVLTSPDGALARLAVEEARRLTGARVRTLAGGTAAWVAKGLPTESSRFQPDDDDCVDLYLRPFDRNHRVEEAMREYLLWEVDLLKELERDGTSRFGVGGD